MASPKPGPSRNPLRETACRVLDVESRAVAALVGRIDESFDRAVELLVGCRGRVVVTGMGKSGIVCQKIGATLASTGTPSFFLHPAEAVHGDLGRIVSGDVLLAISNSGETQEVVRVLELVRRLDARIIALTGAPGSTLARHADVHLDVSVQEEACGHDLVPTASTTAALAMGDALAVASAEARGFTAGDFARNHPGGHLGRRLLLVRQIMHEAARLPAVRPTDDLRRTVQEMSDKGLGMTCVTDAEGRLLGVVTDGDLRRHVMREDALLRSAAADVMTPEPVTVAPDALAAAALRLMEERRITALPVVDAGRRLLGVVQIHDLWRTELF